MYIFNIYSDCCKTILVKIEGMAIPFTFKLAGVKNGNPTWKTDIGVDIYYENGKWIIGYENEKDFISNSSGECPESVESWSNQNNGFKLEGGKIECDSAIYSLDKLKPKTKPKTKN